MMYCLTIHWSGIREYKRLPSFLLISMAADARVSEHSLVSRARTGRLMSPDMMDALSSCSLSITRHPQQGNDDEGSLDGSILLHDGKR